MNNNIKNSEINNINNTKLTNNNFSNNVVKIFASIFIIISLLIVLLLIIYYISPNNYNAEIFEENKFNLMNVENITMEPNSEILLDYYTNKNYYLKIKSKKINKLIVTYYNMFKSQNAKLKSKYLFKSDFYSNLKIKNNSNHRTIVTIKYYTKINKRNNGLD